jgi:hypothetical protein
VWLVVVKKFYFAQVTNIWAKYRADIIKKEVRK